MLTKLFKTGSIQGLTAQMFARSRSLKVFAFAFATASLLLTAEAQIVPVPNAPEVRGQNNVVALTLRPVSGANGHDAFSFNGQLVPPVIRLSPGDMLKIEYVNALPSTPSEPCAITPCMNMTNLHFHGLTVSPKAPQDNVLDMMAMPGQTLNDSVAIPLEQPPGLYWYHTHPHGESHRQALGGQRKLVQMALNLSIKKRRQP